MTHPLDQSIPHDTLHMQEIEKMKNLELHPLAHWQVGSRAPVFNPYPCYVLKYFHSGFFKASSSISLCSFTL